jgi:hypothetical protein
MPGADLSFGWQEAVGALATVSLAGFLVTWIVTDVAHVPRTPYVLVLSLTTLLLAAGYMAWSGTPVNDLVADRWGWAVLAGLAAAGLAVPLVRRIPAGGRPEGLNLIGRFLWEGIVYGTAEAILLSTLPVLAVWQASDALGWTNTTWSRTGSGVLAVTGALFVIAVHHLGYREFRTGHAGGKLLGALLVCGLQALGFLLTGNLLAPVVAHVVLHAQLTLRGIEMPPVSSDQPDLPRDPRQVIGAGTRVEELATHR